MSFVNLVYHKQVPDVLPHEKGLGEVNTAEPIFINKGGLDGTETAVFHVSLIDLLDKAFLMDSLHMLSQDQESFINRYFKEANIASGIIDSNKELETLDKPDPFEFLSSIMKQLDRFLGDYVGEDSHVKYTR